MNIFLTLMLLLLPLLVIQKNIRYTGLNAGLWISLFFWGRIYPPFSCLIFLSALVNFFLCSPSVPRTSADQSVLRTKPAFVFFLSSMMVFCALGQSFSDYGILIGLNENSLTAAKYTGFAGSVAGPVLFGLLSDKRGPFPAVVILLFTAALAIAATAQSTSSEILFPLGQALLWMSISGSFVLLPLFSLCYLGPQQFCHSAPKIIFLLIGLWTFVHLTVKRADTETSTAMILLSVCLVLSAALFSFHSWKNRLALAAK